MYPSRLNQCSEDKLKLEEMGIKRLGFDDVEKPIVQNADVLQFWYNDNEV